MELSDNLALMASLNIFHHVGSSYLMMAIKLTDIIYMHDIIAIIIRFVEEAFGTVSHSYDIVRLGRYCG